MEPQISPQPPNQPIPPPPKKKSSLILVGILFILLAIFAGVVLGKYFYGQKVASPTTEVQPTIGESFPTTPPLTTTPDLTEDWISYKNSQYGYEFKYPANWFLVKMPAGVTGGVDQVYSYKPPEIQVKDPNFWQGKLKIEIGKMIEPKKAGQTLNQWLIEYEKGPGVMSIKISQEEATIDGKKAIKVTEAFVDDKRQLTIIYYIENDNYIYFISAGSDFNSINKNNYNLFLSTFKFLETSETIPADGKTYKSLPLGVEFQYPENIFKEVQEDVNRVRLLKGMGYVFEVEKIITNDTVEIWLEKVSKDHIPFTLTSTTFKNNPAYYLKHNAIMQVPMDMYAVQKKGYVITIAFAVPYTLGVDYEDKELVRQGNEYFNKENKVIVDNILNSFKFLP